MNDENVAVRLTLDRAADAGRDQPLEQACLSCPDNDEIRVPALGQVEDLRGGIAERDGVRGADAPLAEECGCMPQLLAMKLRRVGRIDRADPTRS